METTPTKKGEGKNIYPASFYKKKGCFKRGGGVNNFFFWGGGEATIFFLKGAASFWWEPKKKKFFVPPFFFFKEKTRGSPIWALFGEKFLWRKVPEENPGGGGFSPKKGGGRKKPGFLKKIFLKTPRENVFAPAFQKQGILRAPFRFKVSPGESLWGPLPGMGGVEAETAHPPGGNVPEGNVTKRRLHNSYWAATVQSVCSRFPGRARCCPRPRS